MNSAAIKSGNFRRTKVTVWETIFIVVILGNYYICCTVMLVLMNKVDKLIHVFQDMYVGMQSVSFNRLYVVLDWSLKVHKT